MRDGSGRVLVDEETGKSRWCSFEELWSRPGVNDERDRPMFTTGAPGQFLDSQHSTFLNKENAHGWVRCSYCHKRRCLYKRIGNFTKEDKDRIQRVKDSLVYTCGSNFCTEEDITITQELVVVRRAIQCTDPMKTQYYKSLNGHEPVCCVCGVLDENLEVDEGLSAQYQTVLPMCQQYKLEGNVPVLHAWKWHHPDTRFVILPALQVHKAKRENPTLAPQKYGVSRRLFFIIIF